MKKLVLFSTFVLMMGVLLTPAAFAADKFGSIDVVAVMQKYNKAQDSRTWATKQEEGIQKFIVDSRNKVAAAKETERQTMAESLEKELNKKLSDLKKNKEYKANVILKDVERAIAQVGKTGGYTVIYPSSSILYGTGVKDLTNDVVKILNAK